MSGLTDADRDRFVAYLEARAASDVDVAEQCEKVGAGIAAHKLRTDAAAARLVAAKLRATEFYTDTAPVGRLRRAWRALFGAAA